MSTRTGWVKSWVKSLGLLLVATPLAASETNTITLSVPQYLELLAKAEPEPKPPTPKIEPTLVAEHRMAIRLDGDLAMVESSFELEVKSAGAAAVALPVPGIVESIDLQGAKGAVVGRNASGLLEWGGPLPGRYAVTVTTRLAADPSAEQLDVRVPVSPAPLYEVSADVPAEREPTTSSGVMLESRLEAGRRKLRFAPAPQTPGLVSFARTVARPAPPLAAFARAVVVTHLDLRADEVLRTDTVMVEVLRGELDTLEAKLPAVGDLLSTSMDDGGEVTVDSAGVVTGRRKAKLAKNGYLKLVWRLPAGALGEALTLPPVEPTVSVRARYLVVSSSVAAELAPLPAERWSAVNLNDPPDALATELAARPPVAGWRLDLAPAKAAPQAAKLEAPRLALERLPAIAAVVPPIRSRQTISYLNADGSMLVRERFLLDRHVEALELVVPVGLSLASTKVGTALVQPILRDGAHFVPIAFSTTLPITVEVTLIDAARLGFARRLRHRFSLPRVKGAVFTHRWDFVLPKNMTASRVAGTLRQVADGWAARPVATSDRGAWSVDGVVITDMAAIGASPSYYNFDSFEEASFGSEADEGEVEVGIPAEEAEIEKIPTAREPWAILKKAPGVLVDRINVGGNESGQQSSYISPGTTVEVRPEMNEQARIARFSAVFPESEVSLELELTTPKPRKQGR